MARIRTIKPEFFKHEELFDAEKETGLPLRLAFAGLWTCCDREGRFSWKPRALKTDVLPYDEIDFSRVLDALATRGFIVRYASGGKEYGSVTAFSKHQIVNPRESASKIPPPPQPIDDYDELTREPRVNHASVTRQHLARGEGKGREGEEEGKEERAKALLSSDDDDFSEIQIAFDAYNESATRAGWPKAQALTKTRKAALKARLKEAGGLDGWRVALGKAEASPHLCGQNDRGWTADLDFILQAKSFTKLMEGSYDRRPQGAQPAEQTQRRGIDFDLSKFDDYGNRIK